MVNMFFKAWMLQTYLLLTNRPKYRPLLTDIAYDKIIVVVVVNQFWHFIAAYGLFVLLFSSVLNSYMYFISCCYLARAQDLNSLDWSHPVTALYIRRGSSHQGETNPIVPNSQPNVLANVLRNFI